MAQENNRALLKKSSHIYEIIIEQDKLFVSSEKEKDISFFHLLADALLIGDIYIHFFPKNIFKMVK